MGTQLGALFPTTSAPLPGACRAQRVKDFENLVDTVIEHTLSRQLQINTIKITFYFGGTGYGLISVKLTKQCDNAKSNRSSNSISYPIR